MTRPPCRMPCGTCPGWPSAADRDWTIGDFLAASHTDGFLVLHRGQIVGE